MADIPTTPVSKPNNLNPAPVLTPDIKHKPQSIDVSKGNSSSLLSSIFVTFALFVTLFATAFIIAYTTINKPKPPANYEECTKSKGSRLRESYPAVCVTKNGQEFIQPLSDEEKRLLESPLED